jgi:hypothetical protein
MAEISADKIIGKTLFAKKSLDKLNSSLQKIGIFSPGESVGVVYSYIVRGGSVYWMFYDLMNKPYYVKHTSDSFKFSGGVLEAVQQQKTEKEKQMIQDKGAVPYYIEKYGKWVLYGVLGVALFRSYLKYKK